eukprot:TRINITY_DN17343_c0_g1_i4.p2 TRINITY_DN17343_c0_g1~~TRINITY_DN17343_c0_g1_i4.p2  ORF type:complete len:103 (+),score=16.45 TRINITY_DN17343_c0_g1_i4:120-428(+)
MQRGLVGSEMCIRDSPIINPSIPRKLSEIREEKRKLISEALKGKQGPIFIDIPRFNSRVEMRRDNADFSRSITGVPKSVFEDKRFEYPLNTIHENSQNFHPH